MPDGNCRWLTSPFKLFWWRRRRRRQRQSRIHRLDFINPLRSDNNSVLRRSLIAWLSHASNCHVLCLSWSDSSRLRFLKWPMNDLSRQTFLSHCHLNCLLLERRNDANWVLNYIVDWDDNVIWSTTTQTILRYRYRDMRETFSVRVCKKRQEIR